MEGCGCRQLHHPLERPAMPETSQNEWREGILDGLPVILGYFPYGIAFGVLAKEAGLSMLLMQLMSLTVYAGTAQLIVVAMIQAGEPISAMIFATFIVNSRLILINSAFSQKIRVWKSSLMRFLVSFYLSDETFVVLSNRHERKPITQRYALAVNTTAMFGWAASSALGYLIGSKVGSLHKYGFDFAMTAVLIALAVLLIRNRISVGVAILAGVLGILFELIGLQRVGLLLAAGIASMAGTYFLCKAKPGFSS